MILLAVAVVAGVMGFFLGMVVGAIRLVDSIERHRRESSLIPEPKEPTP